MGFDVATNKYLHQDLFVRRYAGFDADGRLRSDFVHTGVIPACVSQLKEYGVDLPEQLYAAENSNGAANER